MDPPTDIPGSSKLFAASSADPKFYAFTHLKLRNGIVTQSIKSMDYWTKSYPSGRWSIHDSFQEARALLKEQQETINSISAEDSPPSQGDSTMMAAKIPIDTANLKLPAISRVPSPIENILPSQTIQRPNPFDGPSPATDTSRPNPFDIPNPMVDPSISPWGQKGIGLNMFSPQGMGLSSSNISLQHGNGPANICPPTQPNPPTPPFLSQQPIPTMATPLPTRAQDHLSLSNVWKYFSIPAWDGSETTWVSAKMKITTALQKCGMHFLLTAPATTPTNAYHSQLFAIGMLDSFTGEALQMFLGRHENYWRTHGIEMYRRILAKYESSTPDSILSLESQWGVLTQKPQESFTEICNRVEILGFRLHKDEISMVSNTLRGMSQTYSSFKQNVMTGAISITSMEDLKMKVDNFSRISSFLSPGATFKDDDSSVLASKDWTRTLATELLGQYKCGLCRSSSHTIARCTVLTTHLSKFGYEIVRKPSSDTDKTPQGGRGRGRGEKNGGRGGGRGTHHDTPPPPPPSAPPLPPPGPPSPQRQATTKMMGKGQSVLADDGSDTSLPEMAVQEMVQEPPFLPPSILKTRSIIPTNTANFTYSNLYCMGSACSISSYSDCRLSSSPPPHTWSGEAIPDSGATATMWPHRHNFTKYRPTPSQYVLLADKSKIPVLGVGTVVVYFDKYIVQIRNVLHVPDLRAPLYSIRRHRRQFGCSFYCDQDGCFLNFPTFSLAVDDSKDCLIKWSLVYFTQPFKCAFQYEGSDRPTSRPQVCSQVTTRRQKEKENPWHLHQRIICTLPDKDPFFSTIEKVTMDTDGKFVYTVVTPQATTLEVPIDTISAAPGFPLPQHDPTTPTSSHHEPNVPSEYIVNSSAPQTRRFNYHQLHHLLGFRLIQNWEDLLDVSQKTIYIANTGEIPLEIGTMATMPAKHRNTTPLDKPNSLGSIVHMDIGYGDCISVGGF